MALSGCNSVRGVTLRREDPVLIPGLEGQSSSASKE